ncbi:MAG: putative cytokinetic ring protein SteA [Nocardioides sp.]|uniref:putative cytokinetic ring protein SteA n=1 Tax=Nocardioides sp. TaxID=35761 RepID=UPI003F0946AF
MKFPTRQRPTPTLPGVAGTARVERRAARLLTRLRPGDIAVLDHVDMDRALAQSLIDAGVAAVVNASPMSSGRYPNLGPDHLVQAGVPVLDQIGADGFARVRDGDPVRLHEGALHLEDGSAVEGRTVDADVVADEMQAAREGLTAQLESFTHNSTAFLKREQDLLLHGHGVPALPHAVDGRPVVVVVDSYDWAQELKGLKPFLREQKPTVIAVDGAAQALKGAGRPADVVVLSSPDQTVGADVLRKADLVIVLVERGAPRGVTEPLERIGVQAVRFETSATAEDAALILADAADPSLIVGVGMHATLDEFLDRRRPGLASTFLTRLKVGPRLVDAAAVPTLYDGAVRPRHVVGLGIFGAALAAVAVAVTPVGQEWAADLGPWLGDISDYVRGLFA